MSGIHKAISHEWTLELLDKTRFEPFVILLNEKRGSPMEQYLKNQRLPYLAIRYNSKYDMPSAVIQICWFLVRHKIQVVHAHLFDAGLAGMLAAKVAGVKTRIYTRHHSTYHHDYFPGVVKYDRVINALATHIIAASAVVRETLLVSEKANPEKIHLIYHGFEFREFENIKNERIQLLRNKYPISGNPVIGVIARWTRWKGIHYIIPAFNRLLQDYPDAQLVLANAHGEYEQEIRKQLEKLPSKNYCSIDFEEDFMALYQLFHVFVHAPVNDHCEAFGQVYVEALASGIPSVFTLSGIASEFIQHEVNALTVPYENSAAIYENMKRLLADKELADRIAGNGKKIVREKFQLHTMIKAFEQLYAGKK